MKLSDFIATHGKPLKKSAGDHLFRQGDQDRALYVVKSGLLKAYYLSEDGKENIKSFILPGGTIGSLAAGYQKECCTFSLVCMEECDLLSMPFKAVYDASRTDIEMCTDIVDFLMSYGSRKELREYELLYLSAEDRYIRLLDNMPELLGRVTQNEIARYLGVTPVGLSPIKTRVNERRGLN